MDCTENWIPTLNLLRLLALPRERAFQKGIRVQCSYNVYKGGCLPPHIAFSVFCKHSGGRLINIKGQFMNEELLTYTSTFYHKIN